MKDKRTYGDKSERPIIQTAHQRSIIKHLIEKIRNYKRDKGDYSCVNKTEIFALNYFANHFVVSPSFYSSQPVAAE